MRMIVSAFIGLAFALSSQVAHAKPRAAAQARPKLLSTEAKGRGDAKVLNFDEGVIGGTVKTPTLTEVGGRRPTDGHDFVKIRMRWHPEMVGSVSNID